MSNEQVMCQLFSQKNHCLTQRKVRNETKKVDNNGLKPKKDELMKVKGSCLCKAVQFEFNIKDKHFDACHCSMCRSWGGGPAFTVESDSHIKFNSEHNITVFESSSWAERGFCKLCGTHLFYRLKDKSLNFCNFNLGTIQNHEEFKFTKQIFIDSKPENYSFSNKTQNLTEQEIING